MEFKELTKKDAQISLAMELDKLMMTMPEGQKQVVEQDFDGFKTLFGKFINSTGPSVHWDKIEKLPKDAVSLTYLNSHFLFLLFPDPPLCQPTPHR